jgi:hypothetical protein
MDDKRKIYAEKGRKNIRHILKYQNKNNSNLPTLAL